MSNLRQIIGNWGEGSTSLILTSFGYQIIGRNYRRRNGEIDIICRDHDELVFIEVKTRKTLLFGSGEEAITEKKELRLASVAQSYLQDFDCAQLAYRIDLVILEELEPGFYQFRYLRGAIGDVHEDPLDAS